MQNGTNGEAAGVFAEFLQQLGIRINRGDGKAKVA
jgi:hypothetical protein